MKNIFKGLIAIATYLMLTFFLPNLFSLFKIDLSTYSFGIRLFFSLSSQVLVLAIITLLFNKIIIKDFKDIKINHREYFKNNFKYWLLALGLMFISNLIITIAIPGAIAKNQEAVVELFKVAPLYIYISAVFISPLLEELVFRLSLRHIFKKDLAFIILSGLIFGIAHIVGSFENWFDLLYIIPYSIPGIMFAYVYTKTKNIFVPIGLHLIHNGLMMALQIILFLFI